MDYSSWVRHIFETSLADKRNPADAELASSLGPAEALALITRIFHNCGADLEKFADDQVAEGLVFLGSSGESDWIYHIYNRDVPWETRAACVNSMVRLYSDCFARRCVDAVTLTNGAPSAMNRVCYMWWDVFPSGGLADTIDSERAQVDRELIGVMEQALQLPHAACRESALHGLGHWQGADENRVHSIIDTWLANTRNLSPSLVEYAFAARSGNVQ